MRIFGIISLFYFLFLAMGCDLNSGGNVISSDGLTVKNLWRRSKVVDKNTLVVTYGTRQRPALQPEGLFTLGDAPHLQKRPMLLDRKTGAVKWRAGDEAIISGISEVYQYGDVVVMNIGRDLLALNIKTGKVVWKNKREYEETSFGNSTVKGLGGGEYFTADGSKILMGRVSDGVERVVTVLKKQDPLTTRGPGANNSTVPLISANGDTLLVIAQDEYNAQTQRSKYYMKVYNLTQKREESIYEIGESVRFGPAMGYGKMHKGYFIATHEHFILSINPFTGKVRWKISPGTVQSMYDGQFTIVDDLLIIANGEVAGHVYGIDVATGELRWKTPRIGDVSSPFVMDGVIYVTGKGKGILTAMDVKTGKILLELSCPEKKDGVVFSTTPVVGENGIIYFDSERSTYAYEVKRE